MTYTIVQKVLFKHCDPAGIVFYPRYFEMMNDCVEAFFDTELNWPFEHIHQSSAVPTVDISTQFKSPSRHGDILHLELSIIKLGRSSLTYTIQGKCGTELRFMTNSTLVYVGGGGRPTAWPEDIRGRIQQFVEGRK